MTTSVFIVTPSFNAVQTIDAAIASVIGQGGDVFIHYHVQDGGSDDGTCDKLLAWQNRLEAGTVPLLCRGVDFSFESRPDNGMYDAICRGFEVLDPPRQAFMTWINADDLLLPGALGLAAAVDLQFSPEQVSWFSGAAHVIRDDMTIAVGDRPIPTAALRAGICDGLHWDFLQQEGTFFRNWLWSAVKPDETVRPLKLAGDWNLWRLMAQKSTLVQARFPLGGFRLSPEQLSLRQRDAYMAEIDALIPREARAEAMKSLPESGEIRRRILRTRYKDGQLSAVDLVCNTLFAARFKQVFNTYSGLKSYKDPEHPVHVGTVPQSRPDSILAQRPRHEGRIVVLDSEWQFPAITEKHAYHQMRDHATLPEGVTYVAFPWATLIDKLQTRTADAQIYKRAFDSFRATLPEGTRRITVCQHILMKQYLHLFRDAGIDDIFWSHATHEDVAAQDTGKGPRLHPFPLFPVQVLEAGDPDRARPYLFSFIGARAGHFYLSQSRNWILDALRDHPAGLVIGRDTWHYNKVVYEHQIRGNVKDAGQNALVDQDASAQFRASLTDSVFVLCPSGSGPNSIRLWEVMGSGAIPVILADTYAPPGNPALWEAAAVFCEETPEAIAALPDRLTAIAEDPARLAAMRHALRQLWLLYGPESFVYDVQRLALQTQSVPQTSTSPIPDSEALPEGLVGRLAGQMHGQAQTPEAAAFFLRTLCGALLTDQGALREHMHPGRAVGAVAQAARDRLPGDHPAVAHLDRVLTFARRAGTLGQKSGDETAGAPAAHDTALAAPALGRQGAPRICLLGRHANRTPLAYAPFSRLLRGRAEIVADPGAADMVMTGFQIDLKSEAETLLAARRARPDQRIMVLSEEPLWDSLWSGDFSQRDQTIDLGAGPVPWRYVNHHNAAVFDFDRIPYFVLTDDDFLSRYTLWMNRSAQLSTAALLEQWHRAPIGAAFYAEFRDTPNYDRSWPERDVVGLSVWRTKVAQATQVPGVMRQGKGWNDAGPRQKLPDWHLDKLATLAGQVRVQGAYENTHEAAYISEKIFDAFVTGGIPAYYAGPGHRVFDLVPAEAMLNGWGLTPEAAAGRIAALVPDATLAEAWIETARALHDRLADTRAVQAERERVVDAVMHEVELALSEMPAPQERASA